MENIDEFLKRIKPGAKKSKLHEFLPALKLLRDKRYTLKQIQEYLKGNKVEVSVAWLSAFLLAHDKTQEPQKNALEVKETYKTEKTVAENGEEGLARPPGITNAAWSQMKAKARADKRKQKLNSGE
ncbi:MAG: hypothetical protein Q8K61_10595 [Gallionella sp.]|nr:hypothetical protein [Gallionella sp.]